MSSSVCVLCPNGHRVNIHLGPNTPLNNIKQQACEKQGFNPASYGLRKEDRKDSLDLSIPFRLSGLANKAKLELFEEVQRSSHVNVALQLDTGGRVVQRIENTATIAETIQLIGNDASSVSYVMYLQRKIEEDEFGSITLADLGIFKGSAMLRIHCTRQTPSEPEPPTVPDSLPLVEPEIHHMETELFNRGESSACIGPVKCASKENGTTSDMSVMEVEEDTDVTPTNELNTEEVDLEKPIKSVESVPILFNPVTQAEPSSNVDSDDFFEMNVQDLRTVLRDLHKITERQFRFKEPEKEKDIPDHVILRIRFPNGLLLQNVFETKSSTTETLYESVRRFLTEESAENLALYQAPPKKLIKPGQTLIEAGLTSTTLLHAGGSIVMRSDLNVETGDAALNQLAGMLGKPAPTVVEQTETVKVPAPVSTSKSSQQSSSQGTDSKHVPKWFKMK